MTQRLRFRAVLRVGVLMTPVFVAACLGGRGVRRAPASAPAAIPTATDTAGVVTAPKPADSAKAMPVNRDSLFKAADSIRKALAEDSTKNAAAPASKTPAKKPAKQCLLDFSDSPPETRFTAAKQPDSTSILWVGGGFAGHCVGETNRLKADSAEYFEANGFLNLIGNVTYEDKGEFRVTANHATYFTKEGSLYADGNVQAVQLKTGSYFTGPNIEYYRVMPDVRTASRLYAPNSPLVTILQKDSTGKEAAPIKISATFMQDTNDSLLVAWSTVNLQRSEINGRSDSASFDKATGNARLIRAASIQSISDAQPFTLAGDTIDMYTQDQVLNRVLAKHLARAKSGDVNMSAERLDMRIVDRQIDHAFAFGPGRAKAETKGQTLEADSLEIIIPNQLIRELRAFGLATAITKPDSLRIHSAENDVLRGDSVFAMFDSTRAPGDTAAKPQIERVVAMGNASSKVQIASRQGPDFPPAINYIRGRHLVVSFDSGQVREVAVDSAAVGSYYEPVLDTLTDSTKRPRRKPPLLSARPAASVQRPTPNTPQIPANSPPSSTASLAVLSPSRPHRVR